MIMIRNDCEKQYHELFPDDASKAAAFDKIAEVFYFGNFGRLQKSDIETLLFSIYLEQILDKYEEDIFSYSDYTLSKYLGITQSKICNLKVRKELQYPYEKFDWRISFQRLINNARYEDGKIKIYIPDKNLFLEIKNAIEISGGFIEYQYSSTLLQVRPEYFINLMWAVSTEHDRDFIRENLKQQLSDTNLDTDYLEGNVDFYEDPTATKTLTNILKEVGIEILADFIEKCVPFGGKYIAKIIKESLTSYFID